MTSAPARGPRPTAPPWRTRTRSGARRRAASTGSPARSGCSTTTGRRSTAGSPAARSTPASTRSTGTSAPAAATSPRSSTTRPSRARTRTFTYAELLDQVARFAGVLRTPRGRAGRPRRDLPADGARGRRSRCWPAPGSAPCTRWCSAASRRPSSPPASTTRDPWSWSPRPAASSRPGWWSTSRCSTPRSSGPSTGPRARRGAAAPAGRGVDGRRAATSTGTS